MGRQGEQTGLLLSKRLPDGKGLVLWTQTLVGLPQTPEIGLTVEVGQIDKGACGEECGAYVANGSLNSPFFIFMGSSP